MASKMEDILSVFAKWDVDNEGVINKEALTKVLTDSGVDTITLQEALSHADTRKDDVIDYREFLAWLCKPTPATLPEAVDDPMEVRAHLFKAGGLMVPNADYTGPMKFLLAAPGEGKFAMAEPLQLYYFAIRALGQLPQLCLELAGYPYCYHLFMAPYFREHVKQTLKFGRLPCIRTSDGTEIVQSKAVLRYVATLCGLAGKTASDFARCDMLFEMLQTEGALEGAEIEKLKGRTALEAPDDLQKITRAKTKELSEEQKVLAALKFWEDMLMKSTSKWLLGGLDDGRASSVCYVDVVLFWTIRPYVEILEQMGCQHLCGFVAQMLAQPGIQRLLKSGRLMPAMESYKYLGDDLVPAP